MKRIVILFLVVIIQLLTTNHIAYPQASESCIDNTDVFEQIKCLADRAFELSDVAVCDRSKHTAVKYQCYAIYAEKAGNWEICNRIPTDNKDLMDLKSICISDVAEDLLKEDLCEKIDVLAFKDGCYMKIAESTDNKILCEEISDPGIKSLCTGDPTYIE